MLFFNNSSEQVLSKLKELVVDFCQLNNLKIADENGQAEKVDIKNLKDNVTLFSLGIDYLYMLDISSEIENEFLCLPIYFNQSDYYQKTIKEIHDQIMFSKQFFLKGSESARLVTRKKVIQFFKNFYKEKQGKDCPRITNDEVDLGKDYFLDSLELMELRLSVESFFEIKLPLDETQPSLVSLKLKDLVDKVFQGLRARVDNSSLATV